MSRNSLPVPPGIPLAVQLGFAGSRRLLDKVAHPGMNEAEFHAQVLEHLVGLLQELPRKLGLSEKHFFCGVSQIAIGADTIFTRACRRLSIRQRVFLPQHRDAYFAGKSKKDERDFTDAEVEVAQELLRGTHIIEERIVSQSADRSERFEDVNLELARVSDVLIALRRADAEGKPGGTIDLIERARARHKPLLEITVSVAGGLVSFSEKWHPHRSPSDKDGAPFFKPPMLPAVLKGCTIPGGADFAETLRIFSSAQAQRHQWRFKSAALAIVGAHFAATLCALAVLAFYERLHGLLAWLLGVELLFLFGGLSWHWLLHHSRATERWATARLVSEVARSVASMARVPGYLGHFFTLPLPESLRPLLRTLNVFHLEATRGIEPGTWLARRDAYVHDRLACPESGQIPYFKAQRVKARQGLRVANSVFYTGGAVAFLATLTKLLIHWNSPSVAWFVSSGDVTQYKLGLGLLAIILPVLSVAALSLAASFDLEARQHTYEEMFQALEKQKRFIENATFEREFVDLVLQTETRLVGENVNWFSRRAFTGVT